MILKGISVNQNPPAKDYLWITPKGNTRFWNQSTWKLIGGSGDTGGSGFLSTTLFNTYINGNTDYLAKFTGPHTLSHSFLKIGYNSGSNENYLEFGTTDNVSSRIYYDAIHKALRVTGGIYADWVSTLGPNGEIGSGGSSNAVDWTALGTEGDEKIHISHIPDLTSVLNNIYQLKLPTTGNASATYAINISGNALTATSATSATSAGKWSTARTFKIKDIASNYGNNVSIDGSSSTYELSMPANIKVTSLTIGNAKLTFDDSSGVNMLKIDGVSGQTFNGIYSTKAVSALGGNPLNGAGGSSSIDWGALGTYDNNSNHKINIGYLDGVINTSNIPDIYQTKLTYSNGLYAISISGNASTATYATSAGSATTATTATKLGSSTVGSSTKGIYLSSGTPTACSYNLQANVSAGTDNSIAYYSVNSNIPTLNYSNVIKYLNDNNSLSKQRRGFQIAATCVGNTQADLVSDTLGKLSYGDGGPQIVFDESNTFSGQPGALIYTTHDYAGLGSTWHFVSSQNDWNVISKRFHARTGLSVGDDLPPGRGGNSSLWSTLQNYNLYVNGKTYLTNELRIGDAIVKWENGGLHIYNSTSGNTAGIYADWVSALGANPNTGSGGTGDIDWGTLTTTNENYSISGTDSQRHIIHSTFLPLGYTQNNQNYPVQADNNKLYVNVPWTDNDTTYKLTLNGTQFGNGSVSLGSFYAPTSTGNNNDVLIYNTSQSKPTWIAQSSLSVGSASTWTTARTLTIGATGKSVNGSANVSWNTTEINRVTLSSSMGGRVVIALCKLSDSGVDLNLGWAGNIYASRGGQDDFTQWANINIAAIKGLAYGFRYTLITSARNNYTQIAQSSGFRACRFQYTINGVKEWYGGVEFYNSWGVRKFDIDGIYTRSSFTPFIVQYATMSNSVATSTNAEIYDSIDFSTTYCVELGVAYKGNINGYTLSSNVNSGTTGYLAYYGSGTVIKAAGTTDGLKIGNQNLFFNANNDGIYVNGSSIGYHDSNNSWKKTPVYFKKMDDNYTNVYVGINNSSPNWQLDVSGNVRVSNSIIIGSASDGAKISWDSDNGGLKIEHVVNGQTAGLYANWISALGVNSNINNGSGSLDIPTLWNTVLTQADGGLSNYQGEKINSTLLPISAWALASNKPSYSFNEITGIIAVSQIPTLSITDKTSGTLPINRGGTGRTTSPTITVNLASTSTGTSLLPSSGNVSTGITGTLPIANGGTGATSAKGAEYNILSEASTALETDFNNATRFVIERTNPSATNGILCGYRTASQLWSYIKGKMSSDSAVNISGNSATATTLASSVTLWGQSFDGSSNVSGNITNVGNITSSSTNTKTLGSSSNIWSSVYAKKYYADGTASGYFANSKPAIYHNGTNLWIGAEATNTNVFTGGLYLNGGLNSESKRNRVAYLSLGAGDNATTGTNYPIVHKSAMGSSTKGIYLDANGKTLAMSYSLSSTVNAGTTNALAYYSGANAIDDALHLEYFEGTNSATTPANYYRLHLYGSTYGNTANNMISGTAGLFSWGDGGPQITFDVSATPGGAQAGALIFTDNDIAASGVSWHFVSNQNDWNVTSKRFHARTGISIGTNLPNTSYNLYVNGNGRFTGNGYFDSNLFFNSGGDGIYVNANGISYHDTTDSYKKSCFYFKKIDENYNNVYVGINTSAPNYQLDVSGNVHASSDLYLNNTKRIYLGNNASTTVYQDVMKLDANNAFIIGNGTSASSYNTYLDGFKIYLRTNTGHSTRLYINEDGNVGIGNTSPNTKLHVSGNIYATGGVTALQAVSSDKRLKKNIKKFNAKDIVDKLNPVSFEWNSKAKRLSDFKDGTNYGLIAQDSDGIIDNLVFDLPDGNGYKGVRYEKLIPILLQAVKEQQKEIDELKQIIKKLKV